MPEPSGKRRFSLCNDSMKHKKTFPRRKAPPPARRPLRSAPAGPTEWDQAARWYSTVVGDQGSDYQRSLIFPGAFRMLAVKKGDRVLDLACGPGAFSRYMSKKGMRVEGLDASEQLLSYAAARSPASIRFHHADASEPGSFGDAVFDAIACLMALQNMEDIQPVMKNAAAWLKPGGRLVLVVTHPCFRIPRQTHWGWDEEKKMEYRRVDRYASEMVIPILTPPFARSKVFTSTYHRPLESYFKALVEAGLGVDGLEEWVSKKESAPGKRSRGENRARREIPLFLALRARPLSRR
jgi:ubiquinone/menaquinone biosynthesis C-methylase UbiE